MKTRIITALVLVPLLVLVLLADSPVIAAAVIVISAVGLYEFFKATGLSDKPFLCGVGYLAAAVVPLLGYIPKELWLTLGFLFMFLLFSAMLIQHKKVSVTDASMVVFAVIYIPVFLTGLLRIRELESGWILIWLPFVGAFLTDTCAYFAGVFLGKHKLCPEISPKKTIEGSLGGILGCMAACLLYGLLLEKGWELDVNYVSLGILGLLMSIVSQVGDLSASIIKRTYGIKDYGKLFPGHGGILDRLDSVIMITPVVFIFLSAVGIFVK